MATAAIRHTSNGLLPRHDSTASVEIKPELPTQKSLMDPSQFFKLSQLSRTDTSLSQVSQSSQKSLVPLYEDYEPQMPALAVHSGNMGSNADTVSVADGSCGSACDCTNVHSNISSRASSTVRGDTSPFTTAEEFERHPDWMSESDLVDGEEFDDENNVHDNWPQPSSDHDLHRHTRRNHSTKEDDAPQLSQKRMISTSTKTRARSGDMDLNQLKQGFFRDIQMAKYAGIASRSLYRVFEECVKVVYEEDVAVVDPTELVMGGNDGDEGAAESGRKRRAATVYTCPTCRKTFTRKFNLKTHEATHNPDRVKPYPCTHEGCNRSFVRASDLERHVALHNGDRSTSIKSTGATRASRRKTKPYERWN